MSKRNWEATQAENTDLNISEQLLAKIASRIEDDRRAGMNGERNWGHAGDAEHLKNRLLDIVMGYELGGDETEAEARARILNSL